MTMAKLTPQHILSIFLNESYFIYVGVFKDMYPPLPNYPCVLLPQMNTLFYDSLITIPKNPLTVKLLNGQFNKNFLGRRSYPKLPDPHKYNSHIEFNAAEW